MDTSQHQKIKEHLAKSQQVGIVVNKNPNLDVMGAALGLYLSLKHAGKNVAIASPSDIIVEVSNLVGVDKVKRSLSTDGGDLMVSFPYRDGEIEKVSYTIENGYLNIVVKAAEKGLLFQEKDVLFKRGGKPMHMLFFIGVADASHVTDIVGEAHKGAVVVNIDNKPENQRFGDVVVVSPKYSSLSEQIADFLTLPESEMHIDTDIAQNLLSGIMYATNDFQNPGTSHLAFEMAGILMRKGAVRQKKVASEEKKQFQTFTPPQNAPSQPIAPARPQQSPAPRPQFTPTPPTPVESQPVSPKSPPADWLQPKVYKGSSFS